MRRRITWCNESRVAPVLKELRENSGISQRGLALKLGCAPSCVAKIEIGEQKVTLAEFIVWCEALNVKPIDVLSKITE